LAEVDDDDVDEGGNIIPLPKSNRPDSNTTPDAVIISTNLNTRHHVDVLDLIGSDHAPIKLIIDIPRQHQQQNPPPSRTTL